VKDQVPALKQKLVGTSVLRSEDARLLAGRGEYVADLSRPGMRHLVIVRSPYAHAHIRSIETKEAERLAGVELVWTGADTAPLSPGVPATLEVEGMKATVQPVLATDVVRFCGEAVAAIVATSRQVAEDAAGLIEIDYEPLPAVLDAEAGISDGALANDTLTDNVTLRVERTVGDPDAGFAQAAVTVSGTFRTERVSASPLETRGCLAEYEWTTGHLRLWSATQMPHLVKTIVAMTTGHPEHAIEVLAPDVGGGFGQKAHVFPEELLICLLAKQLKRPVRWIEDRPENLLAATHSKQQVHHLELAFSSEGRITGLRDRIIGDGGAYNCFPWTTQVESLVGRGTITGTYKIENLWDDAAGVVTNKTPAGAYRGVGWTAPQIAREVLLDRAARALGISPFEIRRRNVVQPEDFPYKAATGHTFYEGSYREAVDALERTVDYPAFLERQREARAEGRYLGLGVSCFSEINGFGTRGLHSLSFPFTTHDTSTVRVEPTGKVSVVTSVVSQGQGHATTMAQMVADALGLPLSDVVIRAGDSKHTYGYGTWGSRGAVLGAGSMLRSAGVVREKILQLAGHMLEAAPEDLVIEDGIISVSGSPGAEIPFAQVAGAAYFAEATHPAGFDPTLEATCTYDPMDALFSNGAHAFIVDVDVETGLVRIEKGYAVEDCGTMINPMIVEGQVRGGIAQAIGQAYLEEIVYDDQGQMLTTTYMDYLVPTAAEVPDIEIVHLQSPCAFSPGGIKGMGECGMISAPAALVGAVNDAIAPLGALIEHTPVTPERILIALGRVPARR
jgi:carbon-monoxide dehydrogenase large subunit